MGKQVRIGIVGAGFAGHFHMASYAKIPGGGFEIRGIFDVAKDKASELAKQHGIPNVYDTYDAMLADKDLDVIDIVVPNHLHVPLIVKAAEAGKNVFCEKPLTGYFGPAGAPKDWSAAGVSRKEFFEGAVAEANRAWDAVTKAGVTLCYGENWCYAPPIVKARRLMEVSDSTIMRIVGEESHSGSHADYAMRWRTAGGGSLIRLAVHPLGAALHLKAEEGRRRNGKPIRPASVSAEVANLTKIKAFQAEPKKHMKTGWVDVEDFGTSTVVFEDGSVAQVSSTDTVMGGIYNYLTVYGSKAIAKANINPNTACQAYTPDGAYFKDEYIVEKTETKQGWSFPAPDEDMITGYPDELSDFINSVAEKRRPRSDLMLAHDVVVCTYGAYLSAGTGARVDLRPHIRS